MNKFVPIISAVILVVIIILSRGLAVAGTESGKETIIYEDQYGLEKANKRIKKLFKSRINIDNANVRVVFVGSIKILGETEKGDILYQDNHDNIYSFPPEIILMITKDGKPLDNLKKIEKGKAYGIYSSSSLKNNSKSIKYSKHQQEYIEKQKHIRYLKKHPEVARLSERLISEIEDTRDLALKELPKLDTEAKKELVPALIEALKDKDNNKWVRSGAAKALGEIGPTAKKAVPALIAALKDNHWQVRQSAARALGEVGPAAKEAVPALIIAGKDINISSCVGMALKKIGPIANKELVPAFIEALKDNNKWVRSGAAKALGEIGPESKKAVPALIEALKNEDIFVRQCAATALGRIGPAAGEAVPALIIARKDGRMQAHAGVALERIGPATEEAVPALIAALKNNDQWVRRCAATALGQIGPAAKEAVPALIEALKDWDETGRRYAVYALGEIGPTEETAPINEKIGDIFYEIQNWDNALIFYTEATRFDPQNLPLKEKANECRQIAKLEKERVAKGLVVYKDLEVKGVKVRYRAQRFSLLSRLSKERLIERGRNAMVTISADERQGSGFLISDDGYLLTNEHVVGEARFVKAKFLTGKQVSGEVVRIHKFKDVALIKLERGTYPYLPIGDSSKINVGGDVYAIGTPLSEKLSHTVTKGIVGSFRVIDNNRYIQSDVSIHPGNSGGPLLSIGNGVVGICVSGIGFGPITLDLNLFIPIEEAIGSLEIVKIR